MMSANFHAFAQVKPMRRKALHARIEREARAIVFTREIAEPIEKLVAKSLRSVAMQRRQIVHIKKAPIGQIVH